MRRCLGWIEPINVPTDCPCAHPASARGLRETAARAGGGGAEAGWVTALLSALVLRWLSTSLHRRRDLCDGTCACALLGLVLRQGTAVPTRFAGFPATSLVSWSRECAPTRAVTWITGSRSFETDLDSTSLGSHSSCARTKVQQLRRDPTCPSPPSCASL